jgi:hypothetical protein
VPITEPSRPSVVARQDLGVRGHDAADGGEQALTVGGGPCDDLLELEEGGRGDEVLDPRRVVDAGQLHQDAVAVQALALDHRLGDAELVDPVPDRLQRGLAHRHVADRVVHVGRQLEGPLPGAGADAVPGTQLSASSRSLTVSVSAGTLTVKLSSSDVRLPAG